MRPADEDVVEIDAAAIADGEVDAEVNKPVAGRTPAQLIDDFRFLNLSLGLLLGLYLIYWFRTEGFNLNLNIVNWSFLCAGLWLARSPVHYVRLMVNASAIVGVIILQYPFYAGIMGDHAGHRAQFRDCGLVHGDRHPGHAAVLCLPGGGGWSICSYLPAAASGWCKVRFSWKLRPTWMSIRRSSSWGLPMGDSMDEHDSAVLDDTAARNSRAAICAKSWAIRSSSFWSRSSFLAERCCSFFECDR